MIVLLSQINRKLLKVWYWFHSFIGVLSNFAINYSFYSCRIEIITCQKITYFEDGKRNQTSKTLQITK